MKIKEDMQKCRLRVSLNNEFDNQRYFTWLVSCERLVCEGPLFLVGITMAVMLVATYICKVYGSYLLNAHFPSLTYLIIIFLLPIIETEDSSSVRRSSFRSRASIDDENLMSSVSRSTRLTRTLISGSDEPATTTSSKFIDQLFNLSFYAFQIIIIFKYIEMTTRCKINYCSRNRKTKNA